MSDRIAILRNGRFEQIGAAHDIYARPRSRFVAEFMGDVNLFEISTETGEGQCGVEGIDRTSIAPAQWSTLPGKQSALMVRPEMLSFLQPGESADFEITGDIQAEYMLGSRTQYEIVCASGKLVSVERSSSGVIYQDNSRVRLGFSLEDAHVIAEPES